ncbi:uncharacterized protein LOC110822330 [Carica papaya]|uniref:uncharacterized protein LOC110822330 n=1 Tax=Carica papaya TaxID=3649 RepID=UPI000B8CB411|nr:uncharacterized protein LOC110822330 [Carica papaya]
MPQRTTLVYGSSSPVEEGHRFNRPDPLQHFKFYHGGYDIGDKHYWASAAFTGVHGYAIAGAWMLCGLGFGIFLAVKHFGGGSPSSPDRDVNRSDNHYFLLFLLVICFSFLAIIATGFAMAANQTSLKRTKNLKETIMGAGGDARKSIRRVMDALTSIEDLLVPYDSRTVLRLNVTTHRLRKEYNTIKRFVRKNGHTIDIAIQTLYISHLVLASINLALLVAAVVLLLLHWHPGLVMVIFLCWILVTLFWVLTGVDFFIHTLAKDTCSAIDGFMQKPQNNSLSSILPCMDSLYADKIRVGIGSTIHNFITELNLKIKELYGRLFFKMKEHNDFFGVEMVCDPFSGAPNYSYVPESCSKNAIQIGDLPNVLSKFTCYNQDLTKVCIGEGKFIPRSSYNEVQAYSQSIQNMLNVFTDLQNLTECEIVKNTFSDIALHQCPPIKGSYRFLWASMLALSTSTVGLVLLWVVKAYQENGKSFSRCSFRVQV